MSGFERRAPLAALYVANAVSRIGDTLMLLALPWFVLSTTGSVALTGIAAAAEALGVALTGLAGALVVGRLGRKVASVLSDLLGGLVVMAVPVLHAADALPFGLLLVLVFLAGASATPGGIARTSLVPDLAARAGADLDRVNAVIDGVNRVGTLVGAPLAGALIALIGAGNLFMLDGLSFLGSAALLLALVPKLSTDAPEPAMGIRQSLAHLRDGVRFIRRQATIRTILLVVMVTNLLDGGLYSVLAPAYIRSAYHSAVLFGEVGGALGLGALLGTILYGVYGYRLPRRATFAGGFLLGGAPRFWALLFLPPAAPLLVATAAVSTGIGPVNPAIHTALYQAVEPSMQPRVFGALTTGVTIGTPMGALAAGLLAAAWTPWGAMLIFSVIYLAATAVLAVSPALGSMASAQAVPAAD